jgi:hypothetical protein
LHPLTESVVYLLRKTTLTLSDIKDLTPPQLQELIKEVSYQEQAEDYKEAYNIASLMATIVNCTPRKKGARTYKATDFVGHPPHRAENQGEDLIKAAQKRGLKVPRWKVEELKGE